MAMDVGVGGAGASATAERAKNQEHKKWSERSQRTREQVVIDPRRDGGGDGLGRVGVDSADC